MRPLQTTGRYPEKYGRRRSAGILAESKGPAMSSLVICREVAEDILGKGRPTNACDQHRDGTTSKWTLFPDSVLPLENVWPHWQLPYQWHSWSPPLTATIHSPSSTPKLSGRGPVSIFPRKSSTHVLRGEQPGRKAVQAGNRGPTARLFYVVLWLGGQSQRPCGMSPPC